MEIGGAECRIHALLSYFRKHLTRTISIPKRFNEVPFEPISINIKIQKLDPAMTLLQGMGIHLRATA